MMSSIRARLWLSYLAVIVVALAIVASVLTVFLIRNPYTYRQAALRVTAAAELAARQPRSSEELAVLADALGVRILSISRTGEVTSDTAPSQDALRIAVTERRSGPVATTRDLSGRPWLYAKRSLPNGDWQIIATTRPGLLPLLGVVRDELWRPMVGAGLVALLFGLGLAYVIARWIADPMQALVETVRSTAGPGGDKERPAPPAGSGGSILAAADRGPAEVRELARAFDAMLRRVAASQRRQKEFVANVSHELKTPLTAIMGFSTALLDGTAASESARHQAAETIQGEATRMFRLATDLLDLARLDAQNGEFSGGSVDIAEIIVRLKARFSPIAAAGDVALHWESQSDIPRLTGDGERLMQALANILDNAIKFSPPGSRVSVKTAILPDEVQVLIVDDGPGIPKGDQERIFDRFYQVDASRKGGRSHGAGLGLAIAREVVEGLGGKIHVRSTSGHGAEFSVHLPRRVSSSAERAAA